MSFLNLEEFLDGGIGVVSSQHKVNKSFSRMLIANESKIDGLDMQVTHSNFNYKKHGCDFLKKDDVSSLNCDAKIFVTPINTKNRYKNTLA